MLRFFFCLLTHVFLMSESSDVQGLGKPLGFKGKGQEGKGQGKDFMTLSKPLPL